MSDDDFLARWSRRKRMARSMEARISDEAACAAEAEADSDPQRTETAAAATEPPEPLPSLEDLTADGDLAAFLRDGVPRALRNAAMRRMWSLDPAIRDYVGPAEYAWDFNEPGSMPGFGALEPGRSVADFLSTVSRVVPADTAGATMAPKTPSQQITAVAPAQDEGFSPVETVQPPEPAHPRQPAADVAVPAEPAEEACLARSTRDVPRPRHGGALPR